MASISGIFVRIGASTGGLDRGLSAAEKRIVAFGRKVDAMGQAMLSIGAPAAAVIGAATAISASFEKSMAKSTAIMGELSDEMRGDLAQAARDTAKVSEFSANQAADAYFFLASAGLDAAQSLKALPQVTAFATAGQFDLARATDLATDAQSALGLTVKDAEQNLENLTLVTDTLIQANTLANASAEQFAEGITGGAGAAARLVGMDIAELTAILATFADQGIKGADASTKTAIVLRDLQKAALNNKEAFEEAGISVFDANGEFRAMKDILGELETALAGASDEQARLTIQQLGFTDKSVGALLALVGFSEKLGDYETKLRQVGGTTQDVAGKQLDNLGSQFVMLKNQVADVAISFGDALRPQMEGFLELVEGGVKVVGSIVEWFAKAPPVIRDIVVNLTAVVTTIGLLSFAFAKLLPILVAAKAAILGTPWGIAITAMTTLVPLVVSLSTGYERHNAALRRTTTEYSGATSAMLQFAEGVEQLEAKQKALEAALAESSNKLLDQQAAGEANSETARDLAKEVADLQAELGKTEMAARLQRALEEIQGEYKGTGREAMKLREQIEVVNVAYYDAKARTGDLSVETMRYAAMLGYLEQQLDEVSVAQQKAMGSDFATQMGETLGIVGEGISGLTEGFQGFIGSMVELQAQQPTTMDGLLALNELLVQSATEVEKNRSAWQLWGEDMALITANTRNLMVEFGNIAFGAFQQLSQGIGKTLAQSIVFGESFGKSFTNMIKSVAANFIASLIDMGIQLLIFQLLSKVFGLSVLQTQVSASAGQAAAGAYAWVMSVVPWPLSTVLAPIEAARAFATTQAVGMAGAVGMDVGGMTTADGLAMLHKNEVVMPFDRVEALLPRGGDRPIQLNLIVDNEVMARGVIHELRDVLNVELGLKL